MKYSKSILKFIALFAVGILILSCNKKSDHAFESANYKQIDHLRIYFEGLHPNDQHSVFNGLPSEIKYALFDSHLKSEFNNTDKSNEMAYILGLIDNLKPIYYKDTAVFNREGAPYFKAQINEGLRIFNNDSAKVASILYQIKGDADADIMVAWEKPNCECNLSISLCVFGTCGVFDCTVSVGGCGPVWAMPCDGMCLGDFD
jgi:hypothetical protein